MTRPGWFSLRAYYGSVRAPSNAAWGSSKRDCTSGSPGSTHGLAVRCDVTAGGRVNLASVDFADAKAVFTSQIFDDTDLRSIQDDTGEALALKMPCFQSPRLEGDDDSRANGARQV